MDTISIRDYIRQYQKKNIFKGVFPCDGMPHNFSLPAAFIINLSPCNEPGTHWVAFYINAAGVGIYFDSFGMKPTNRHIISFIRMHTKETIYNRKQIQHITSNKCGRFCCIFIVSMLKKCSVNSFINRFGLNLYVNDIIVENMYSFYK